MRNTICALALSLLATGCGSGSDGSARPDAATDADASADLLEPDTTGGDAADTAEGTEDTTAPDVATTPGGLPLGLPFVYLREAAGEPMSAEEVADFTAEITGFWKDPSASAEVDIDFPTYVFDTCHGTDASTGLPDYMIWWHDVDATKEGDTVTFWHNPAQGGSHNNAEPTSLMLAEMAGGYLASGDPTMGALVEQFAKSFTAVMLGFVYDAGDPLKYLMTRNIATIDHEFELPGGRKKRVEYNAWYFPYTGWNANRYRYESNPYWGDIWVTTMRSKDDVPFMYRATGWLMYVAELAPDESVRAAAAEAVDMMVGFARDIVDQGWLIRTKDENGQPYVPTEDLASFVAYTELVPDAECDARLSTALLAYGDDRGVDCGDGEGSLYDAFATAGHYYNYSIIDHFHMAALQLALIRGEADTARELLDGLVARFDRYADPDGGEAGAADEGWDRDNALRDLQAAALGMPLTWEEARAIVTYHHSSVEAYRDFPNWDLWASSVPDGDYDFRTGYRPARSPSTLRVEDLAFLMEYCWSPFRNPASVPFVDCDIVRDRGRWGER